MEKSNLNRYGKKSKNEEKENNKKEKNNTEKGKNYNKPIQGAQQNINSHTGNEEKKVGKKQNKTDSNNKPDVDIVKPDKLKILVADEPDVIDGLYDMQTNYQSSIRIIGTAIDGELAKQQVKDLRPDVIFANVDLPQKDGFELAKELKDELNDIPVVLSVHQDDGDDISKANKIADDVVLRPFDGEDFIKSVSSAYTEVQKRKKINKQAKKNKTSKKFGQKRKKNKDKSDYDFTDIDDLNEMVEEGIITEAEKIDYLKNHRKEILRARQNTIAVYSPKGGVGTTFLASNIAMGIANKTEDLRVVLVDLDFGYSNIDSMLGIAGSTNIMDLYNNYDKKNQKYPIDILEEVVIHHPTGLDILLGPPRLEQGDLFQSEHIKALIEGLKEVNYDIIIFDTTTELRGTTLTLLENVKNILLVIEQNVCTINDSQKIIETLESLDISKKKISLILNKTSHNSIIATNEIYNHIGLPLKGTIPNDQHLVDSSINKGEPIVLGEPNDIMRRILSISALSDVCPELQRQKLPKEKKGFFKSLFSSNKKKKKKS